MLVNSLPLIKKAKSLKIAIPAFNIHNLETVQAVVEAAYEMQSPVIIQTTPGTLKHAGLEYIGNIVKTASEMYDIPIALHMDHCQSFEMIIACLKNNYTSVMIDGSHLPYHENVALVRKVVEVAHSVGVQVEAEIGKIGGVEDDLMVSEGQAYTDPYEARKFVTDTNVDTLAIAIGTAHGVYKGEPKLDFDRIEEIDQIIDVPLVLHGASGVPEESVRLAIRLGMAKINIATELKIPMSQAIQKEFDVNPDLNDPRIYMGAAKDAVKEVVKEKIRICGTEGLASLI